MVDQVPPDPPSTDKSYLAALTARAGLGRAGIMRAGVAPTQLSKLKVAAGRIVWERPAGVTGTWVTDTDRS